MTWRVGIDTGGTFTDVVAVHTETGELVLHKVHSTPGQPAQAVVNAVTEIANRAGFALEEIGLLLHGSTVATNAVLTRTGARLAVVTTRGFRDILQIRRQNRPEMYDLRSRRPASLVPRSHIVEVDERVLFDGSVLTELTPGAGDEIVVAIEALDVDAIVVGFLNAYVNPVHEAALGERLRKRFPNTSVCLSHEVTRSQGEFERFSTAVLNGYVQPMVTSYLGRLEEDLRSQGVTAPLFVMKSNGGVAAANVVSDRSVEMLLSGPAGGVVAGAALAAHHTNNNLITADMGGTSFDVAMIHEGAGIFNQQRLFADQAIALPMMDIDTIGAGGGSIGWVDAGGALRVGPHSAGAAPGPACYGRGGTQPTITDANLVLHRLAPHSAMAGGFELDVDAARRALGTIAAPIGLSIEEAAEGMTRVVNANMTAAIRRLTVERGYDPAAFTLCAFGGAGPLHGAELGREIGVHELVIPSAPGVFSAFGLLLSELREEQVHSRLGLLSQLISDVPAICERLLEGPRQRLAAERMGDRKMTVTRRLRLRYLGQGHDLPVVLGQGAPDRTAIEADFHRAHRQAYGYDFAGEPVEVVAAWVTAALDLQDTSLPPWTAGREAPPATSRPVYFDGATHDTPVYQREDLGAGFAGAGPAMVEQPDTTIAIPPAMAFRVDGFGHLVIQVN